MSAKLLWGDDFTRLDPVKQRELDTGRAKAPPVQLRSGRNMFASFQLSIGPIGKNETASVSVGPLKGAGKAGIGANQADVFVEWYHHIEGQWYPEVCVPQTVTGGSTPAFRKLNGVPDQTCAGFWVDLFVPADARPGRYEGTVQATIGKDTVSAPVTLDVVKARLGHESCLDVSMNNYADGISSGWPDLRADPNHLHTAKYRRVERGVFRTAHEHRMFLHYLPYGHSGLVRDTFAPPLVGEGPRKHVASWTEWDRHFGGYLDGSAFKGTRRGAHPVKRLYTPLNLCWPADFLKFGQPGYEAEWRAVGGQMVEHFKQKGWTKTSFDMFPNHKQRFRFFPWDTEEVRFPADNDVHRYLGKMWKGTFDRASARPVRFDYTLGTTWTFADDLRSDMTDIVDVFIGGAYTIAESRRLLPKLRAKNRQLWACLNSGSILKSTRAAAYPPLMIWMLDAQGYMPRWSTMQGWGKRGWRDIPEQGAATFLYCGSLFGSEDTFASVRMKVQRNAIQTVDLFQSAADTAKDGKSAVKRRINRTLTIPGSGWYPSQKFADGDNDRHTEEPPLAGWEKFSADQYRALSQLALTMASGEKQ